MGPMAILERSTHGRHRDALEYSGFMIEERCMVDDEVAGNIATNSEGLGYGDVHAGGTDVRKPSEHQRGVV